MAKYGRNKNRHSIGTNTDTCDITNLAGAICEMVRPPEITS